MLLRLCSGHNTSRLNHHLSSKLKLVPSPLCTVYRWPREPNSRTHSGEVAPKPRQPEADGPFGQWRPHSQTNLYGCREETVRRQAQFTSFLSDTDGVNCEREKRSRRRRTVREIQPMTEWKLRWGIHCLYLWWAACLGWRFGGTQTRLPSWGRPAPSASSSALSWLCKRQENKTLPWKPCTMDLQLLLQCYHGSASVRKARYCHENQVSWTFSFFCGSASISKTKHFFSVIMALQASGKQDTAKKTTYHGPSASCSVLVCYHGSASVSKTIHFFFNVIMALQVSGKQDTAMKTMYHGPLDSSSMLIVISSANVRKIRHCCENQESWTHCNHGSASVRKTRHFFFNIVMAL